MRSFKDVLAEMHKPKPREPEPFAYYRIGSGSRARLKVTELTKHGATLEVISCTRKECVGQTMRIDMTTGFIMRAKKELLDMIDLRAVLTIVLEPGRISGTSLATLVMVEQTS
jgi:hypothetical protein